MKRLLIIICALISCNNIYAQEDKIWDRLDFGVQVGFDLGAAAPWPISDAVGKNDRLTAVPHITPALGLVTGYSFNDRWSLCTEISYRRVGVDATIVTMDRGQNFTMDGDKVLFRGQATMSMSFSQMEIPLYVKYKINNVNRVTLGVFYSYVARGEFIANALEGSVVNVNTPDATPEPIVPGGVPEQNFSSALSNWDIGYQVGYERLLGRNLSMGGRFTMGVKDIFKSGEKYLDYSMLQMRGTLNLVYRFW